MTRTATRDELTGHPAEVAPRLLNLVVAVDGVLARIVEVEAYAGVEDPASHAFRGPTPRTESMFGAPGTLYVYRSYGIHWCANVTLAPEGIAGAALLRAVEPISGVEHIRARRSAVRRDHELTNGPGKLCAALGIDAEDDGIDVLDPSSRVQLLDDGTPPPDEPHVSTRVGISRAVDRPWRFSVPGSPWVSRGRSAGG